MKPFIVIGHNQTQKGAFNRTFITYEYDFNLKLATCIKSFIDCEVRTKNNKTRSQVIDEINLESPSLVIELHCNAFNELAEGTETLFTNHNSGSIMLAEVLQDKICKALARNKSRGIKLLSEGDRGYSNLKGFNCPCCIIEPFFIDNDQEYRLAISLLPCIAQAISNSIETFLNK